MATELTPSQQSALEQLQQVTAGEDPDRELAVLESVGWNVERAVQAFFDQEDTNAAAASSSSSSLPGPSRGVSAPTTSRTVEQLSVDDSSQGHDNSTFVADRLPPRRGAAPAYPGRGVPQSSWLSVISFPFTPVGGLLGFIFRLLRIPFVGLTPYFFRGTGGGAGLRPGFGRSLTEEPAKVAERFVRELEDETGALTVSHAAQEKQGDGSGPSSSSAAAQKRLPDFFIGSYDQALKTAESDLKVLCVVIQSSEHDDVPLFRRTVLTDPDFVRTVSDNDFIVWGGDIRQRDAYQASHKLGATTYPFVAFLALHPVPAHLGGSSRGNSSTPRLTVLSRHEGSPTTITSAHTLSTHITTSLLPRVTPLLTRLRTERWERAQERRLREEQDQAFALTAARDRERVEKRLAEERAAAEAARQRELEKQAIETKKANIVTWRRYARKALVPPEPQSEHGSRSPVGSVRVGVKLPDGKRVIRRFAAEDSASALYAFVETQLIPPEYKASDDPEDPPAGYGEHEWTFKLVTSYPRKEIPDGWDLELGSIPELRGGANLALELKPGFRVANGADEDDESSEGESE